MKKLLACLAAAVMLAVGTNAAFEKVNTYNNNFSDVKDTNWFSENVKSAYELGFMNGKTETTFDPNGNVTVAEGITMAARVHSIYNGTEIKKTESTDGIFRIDFDEDGDFTPWLSTYEIDDGVLVLTPTGPNSRGVYDPGLFIENLDLKARNYDKIKIRMKRDALDNVDPTKARNEKVQIYFQTSNDVNVGSDRCATLNLKTAVGEDKLTEWFEIELPLSTNTLWKDTITRFRIDPTDNNGVYYFDYIELSKNPDNTKEKWYDIYVDYALENKIIEKNEFKSEDYTRNITRAEMCELLASALPEEYFAPINNVTAIPDLDKNDKYADIILMLYRAGVVLGSDAEGTFNASSDIKRSEVAAIINRVALPENRVEGEIIVEWDGMYYTHDLEFDDPDMLSELYTGSSYLEIKDGHLIIVPEERDPNKPPRFDPKVGKLNTSIRADEFRTLKVRMKMELEGEVTSLKGEFYFTPEGVDGFNETNALKPDFGSNYYVDAAGWRVYTFFLGENETWKGNITGFRFDPSNNAGTYTIDYIRFVRDDSTRVITDEELANDYISRELFPDEGFENGFVVYESNNQKSILGNWTYNEGTTPVWHLLPWWTNANTILDGEDKYSVTDSIGAKVITYNPEEKSITMRLNADKVYEGKAHVKGEKWPHILIEQFKYEDENYNKVSKADKELLDLGADKVYIEMDVKLNDFVDLDAENRAAGAQSFVQYNVYLYAAHKEIPDIHTYFGVNPFDSRGPKKKYSWVQDSVSIQMIYGVPTGEIFGGTENTFINDDGSFDIGEWKHIRFDITPHLENLCSVLTRDDTLGREVKREDLWLSGANIGFEIWGNYQAEMEIKNFNVICYDKK